MPVRSPSPTTGECLIKHIHSIVSNLSNSRLSVCPLDILCECIQPSSRVRRFQVGRKDDDKEHTEQQIDRSFAIVKKQQSLYSAPLSHWQLQAVVCEKLASCAMRISTRRIQTTSIRSEFVWSDICEWAPGC